MLLSWRNPDIPNFGKDPVIQIWSTRYIQTHINHMLSYQITEFCNLNILLHILPVPPILIKVLNTDRRWCTWTCLLIFISFLPKNIWIQGTNEIASFKNKHLIWYLHTTEILYTCIFKTIQNLFPLCKWFN